MRTRPQSYAHHGDRIRRNARIRTGLLLTGLVAAVAMLPHQRPGSASASALPFSLTSARATQQLHSDLSDARGALALANAQLAHANAVIAYSARYDVRADIAQDIYDIALAEGIEPDLGFRLVRVESEFNPHATSPVGALGLTQLMPSTAAFFQPGVTRAQLYKPAVNLRLGFRYLRSLIAEYHGNVRLALLVYNRGPAIVQALRAAGRDPRNGYARSVLRGYTGSATVN